MSARLLALTCIISFVGGCKTIRGQDDSSAISELASNGNSLSCENIQAVSLEKKSGVDVFNLTEQCFFNKKFHTLKIRLHQNVFEKVLDGCKDKELGWGLVDELDFDGHKIEKVGIKVRGNTSRCNDKRQFKFSFNETKMFEIKENSIDDKAVSDVPKNRNFFGLENFSVRASSNDPSMIREKLSSDGLAAINLLSPTTERGPSTYRVSFANLFVTNGRTANEGPEGDYTKLIDGYYYSYKGVYSIAENLDEVFVQSRFAKESTKLKNFHLMNADKAKGRLDRKAYDPEGWSISYYKGDKPKDDATKAKAIEALFSLMDVLKSESTDEQLESLINIDSVTNYMIGATLNGHWDSLLATANNDALFFDGKRWHIIAWDMDNSLGAGYDNYKTHMRDDIYQPAVNLSEIFSVVFAPKRTRFRSQLRNRFEKALATGSFYSAANFGDTVKKFEEHIANNGEGWEKPNIKHENFENIENFMKSRRSKIKVNP